MICITSPILVVIPTVAIVTFAPDPPVAVLSMLSVSPFTYADPPSIISTAVTALLATVTFAVAPSQLFGEAELSNLTL